MPKLKLTLKAWPVITLVTIGLCFCTQTVASWFGIDLPEQKNVDIVRFMFTHAFDSIKAFGMCVLNVSLILMILPALEELVFRGLFFKLPSRWCGLIAPAAVSSVLFAAAHYLAQPWPDNAFVALAFFGIAQCWLYRRSGYIWCTILNHSLFNLTNLALMFVIPM